MKAIVTAFALSALALPISAQAQVQQAEVEYRDLNLSTPEGQEKLDYRIDRAAKAVCQFDDITVGSRIRSHKARECVEEAKRKIREQVAVVMQETEKGG